MHSVNMSPSAHPPRKTVFFVTDRIPLGFEALVKSLNGLGYEFFANPGPAAENLALLDYKFRPSTSHYNFGLTVIVGNESILNNQQQMNFVRDKNLPVIVDPHDFEWIVKVLAENDGQLSKSQIAWLKLKASHLSGHVITFRAFDALRP